MADDSPSVYDQRTALNVLRRLDALERRHASLLGGGYNQSFVQGPLVTRWGVTSTVPDYSTYPTSGNVVGVTLGDYEPSPLYPGATAVKTFTAYTPPQYVYATTEDDSMPDEGTYVKLVWRNGRWWIVTSSAPRSRCVMVATSTDYGWRDGDGGTTLYPVIGWNGATSKSVKLFPAMNGFTANGEGTAYTVVSSPAAYADDWLTLEQDARYCITWTEIWGLPSLSLSDAESYLRAASHTHSYTDDGSPMTTGSATPSAQSLTRKLVGIESRVDFTSGADYFDVSTAEQMYYVPGTSPDDEWRVWATIVAYVRRNGSDIGVNLKLTKAHGANESRPYHVGCYVKIEQTSES